MRPLPALALCVALLPCCAGLIRARVLLQDGKYWLETVRVVEGGVFWQWPDDDNHSDVDDVEEEHRGLAIRAIRRSVGGRVVAAKAEYGEDREHASGFGHFRVTTNPRLDDDTQAYAAGFVEGALTSKRIYQNYLNMRCQVDCSGEVPTKLTDFFETQKAWASNKVSSNPECHFWRTIGATLRQKDGMLDGYSLYSKEPALTAWAFDLINALGDLLDIKPALFKEERPSFESMDRGALDDYLATAGHCSAIVRATADLGDLLVGHSSWFSYSSMLRIFKVYELNLQNPRVSSRRVAFSSYPGMLVSLDDFYMMSSGLAMVQTTNPTLNASLWDMIVPESLLAWQRVKAANTLASDGQDWYKWVSRENSGTYNNQYMVVDFNRFTPHQALPPNTLWIVEQIPGLVMGADATAELERGYWPSFNIPYFPQVYNLSGFPRLDHASQRTVYSEYEMAPRAQIFRRDHGKAEDLDGAMAVLRYNDFENDPISEGNPFSSICARGDLADKPRPSGCYDTKVTNKELFWQLRAWVVNGPTTQGQPAFEWSSSAVASAPHNGQPDVFNFTPELMGLV